MDVFFPKVGWRFIGGGHYAYLEVLKSVLVVMEYGLYEYSELEELLKRLYTLTETCENLEYYSSLDAKLKKITGAFLNTLR
jgi:hypothetical protein